MFQFITSNTFSKSDFQSELSIGKPFTLLQYFCYLKISILANIFCYWHFFRTFEFWNNLWFLKWYPIVIWLISINYRLGIKNKNTNLIYILFFSDESHDCFALKYLTEKPITSLSGDQWLKLIEAEKQKILQIDFAKDIKSYTQGQTYLEDAQKLYLFDAFSASVKEWNSLREQCVEIAFTKLLYPMLRKELR